MKKMMIVLSMSGLAGSLFAASGAEGAAYSGCGKKSAAVEYKSCCSAEAGCAVEGKQDKNKTGGCDAQKPGCATRNTSGQEAGCG